MVTGADALYRVASDGSGMTRTGLPSGYVAVAPTSDPHKFILAPKADAEVPYGLTSKSPFHAYLWDEKTAGLQKVADAVNTVQLGSGRLLAYLHTPTEMLGPNGGEVDVILALRSDGTTYQSGTSPLPYGWTSPDGSRYLWADLPWLATPQSIELRKSPGDDVLLQFQASVMTPVWSGKNVAFVSIESTQPSGPAQEGVIVLLGTTMQTYSSALPAR